MSVKLLFLDIDGVLNRHDFCPIAKSGSLHKTKVALLNYVLEETGAYIVVSSAWRYLVHNKEMSLTGFDWLLRSHGVMHGRLRGITRQDTLPEGFEKFDLHKPHTWPISDERGQQIADYLSDDPYIARYAVVDDLDLGISKCNHPFVQTNQKRGLTLSNARQLVRLLR